MELFGYTDLPNATYLQHFNDGPIETVRMTKSELIHSLSKAQSHLADRDVELAVKDILENMSEALATGHRIEVRGFGSFALHFRPPRQGRNPKTGESVALPGKYVPHFKPGKNLRDRVNKVFEEQQEAAKPKKTAAKSRKKAAAPVAKAKNKKGVL